jgi:excisionase family DNA binding protein
MTDAEYDIGISQNFLTIQGVSQYLGIKPKTLYARIQEIPHYKVGRLVRFKREDIDAWMERFRVTQEKGQDRHQESESSTPASERAPKPPKARRSRKRKGLITDIDRMISKAIDQVKGEGYTPPYGKSDQVKGSGEEV